MKKWFVFSLVLLVAGLVRAQGSGGGPEAGARPGMGERTRRGAPPAEVTKEQFVEHAKMMAEQKGEEFDPAAAEAKFAELDKNKDGVLTGNEMPRAERGPRGPVTKEQFMAREKARAERAGEEFDPAAAEARFAELDKNKDGVLTRDEMPMRPRKPREEAKDAAGDDGNGDAAAGHDDDGDDDDGAQESDD